jgi:Tol biopolymer transport system component
VITDLKGVNRESDKQQFAAKSNIQAVSRMRRSARTDLCGGAINISSFMPQWSPDSKSVAFSDLKEIYVVSADGGAVEKLTSENKAEVAPSWWPDGKSIVFNDFQVPGQLNGLKVINLATKKISIMPGSVGFFVPSWSPNGQFMAAMAVNLLRMVLYSAQTASWTDLKRFKTDFGYWIWSSDSKSLYLAMKEAEPAAEPGIYRLTIADAKWELFSKFGGLTISSDALEGFPCITPDGLLAIMADTSAVQIYSAKWNKTSD